MLSEDAYVSDDEELECPLCMEEFDISDKTFKPCPCGYQICRFCYNRIVNSETANGCPACRRQYSEETVEFKPLSAEEWKKDQQRIQSRKLKEKEKRESELASRRHLSNMRVVQKNLVYVIGFSPKSADADLAATLRGNDYFAQYGKINKIVVNKKSHPNGQPTVGVYITFARKEDAAKAVAAVDGTINDGRILRASFGTTKYCSAYLRQQVCQNPNCMYLHEPGEDLDSYTREDMSTIQHAAKAADGMHANALAAHHMRRQVSKTDSVATSAPADEVAAHTLPPAVVWAAQPKNSDTQSQTEGHSKPDVLPAPAKNTIEESAIPPPPSQASKSSSMPSGTPSGVQPGIDHPFLGDIIKSLYESNFSLKIETKPIPGLLTEQDIKLAQSFPALFSWNPAALKRPSSPSKAAGHARHNSRYAFASDSKPILSSFIPPGLATNVQPPGFKGSSSLGSDHFPTNLSQTTGALQRSSILEEPRQKTDSGGKTGQNTQHAPNVSDSIVDRRAHSLLPESLSLDSSSEVQPTKVFPQEGPSRSSHGKNSESDLHSKQTRSLWEPVGRPRADGSSSSLKLNTQNTIPSSKHGPKSSGTWQPSPPPPREASPFRMKETLMADVTPSTFDPGDAAILANPVPVTPARKGWNNIAPVAAAPIQEQLANSIQPTRRDSYNSTTSFAEAAQGRSRQSSFVEVASRASTPARVSSPISPVQSRASSPAMVTPALHRTLSSLSATPTVSSPLANLNTGKAIRILSQKPDEAQIKAEKIAAEERAIKAIKDQEAAALAKSLLRKSVPATSVKKSKEQKAAELKEKLEKREESITSSVTEEIPVIAEIAPVIGRARKQKNKQIKQIPRAISDEPEVETKVSPETTPEKGVTDDEDISTLASQLDLTQYSFFKPIPNHLQTFEFSEAELSSGAELLKDWRYTGSDTVEQIEKMLAAARKETADYHRALEKLQKRNMTLTGLTTA